MARLDTYPLSAWIRYYSNYGTRTLERWQEAIEHLESEKYTPEKFMSDIALSWADLANGWWTAMRQTATGPIPTAFMKILSDDQVAAEGNVAVESIGEGILEITEPVRLGASADGPRGARSGTQLLAGKHVDIEPHRDKASCLRIIVRRIPIREVDPNAPEATLREIAAEVTATPHFTPGTYQSLVHQNGKLLAIVVMLVVEGKKS